MTSTSVQSCCTDTQISAWLRGLLSIAWVDGNFSEREQTLITSLTHHELTPEEQLQLAQPIAPAELVAGLGSDPGVAENFMRTAVMVALADGVYSFCEDEALYQFCTALGLNTEILDNLRSTLVDLNQADARATTPEAAAETTTSRAAIGQPLVPPGADPQNDVLYTVRDWLDNLDIHDPRLAHFLCKMIPPQCPFERDIVLFGRKLAHIPAMCKLNPLYDQLVGIRFRALSYLADECGEDVSQYC